MMYTTMKGMLKGIPFDKNTLIVTAGFTWPPVSWPEKHKTSSMAYDENMV